MREAERILRTRAEAEDAVQEAFVRAWRNSESCRTPEAPLPWLLQITRNEALRLLSRRAERAVEDEPALEPAADDPAVTAAPERLDLGRALALLSDEDRMLLELRYNADLTQPAVARRLGLPEGTVKVRLHRLRARLRLALEGGL